MRLDPLALGCVILGFASFFSAPAHAGGIGVIGVGGVHQENLYVYDDADVRGPETNQWVVHQRRPSYGFGVQGMLGDRDDRVQGIFRFYYLQDAAAQSDGVAEAAVELAAADDVDVSAGDLIFATPNPNPRHLGVATAGVQWGILPEPGALQIIAVSSIGAGALTTDSTEFVLVELGGGATYRITETIELNGELVYDMRIRKAFYHGASANVGVRFLFD